MSRYDACRGDLHVQRTKRRVGDEACVAPAVPPMHRTGWSSAVLTGTTLDAGPQMTPRTGSLSGELIVAVAKPQNAATGGGGGGEGGGDGGGGDGSGASWGSMARRGRGLKRSVKGSGGCPMARGRPGDEEALRMPM